MKELRYIFDQNRDWATGEIQNDPKIFEKQSEGQMPKFLWIGCSDSRVHPNEIMGVKPGEVFVLRNIANLFPENDTSCMAVLEFAVNSLKIEHVIVCGHYGCGGILASMQKTEPGAVDSWLDNIRKIDTLPEMNDVDARGKALVELNAVHQAQNIAKTDLVKRTWKKGQRLVIHGWIYDMSTGLLKDLDCCITGK